MNAVGLSRWNSRENVSQLAISPPSPRGECAGSKAAGYLGVSEGFLEKAACRGDGPAYLRLSARLVLYERAELDRWATARRVTSSAEAANLAQSMKAA